MSNGKKMKPEFRPDSAPKEEAAGTGTSTPRKLSFAENAILTVKVLAGFGLLGAALWGLSLWTSK